jgi:cell division transport system permease protein
VEPWLGPAARTADLPLPALVDVRIAAGTDVAALRGRLQTTPGVTVEEPGTWLADLRLLAQSVRWVSMALLLVIGSAAVGAVIFSANAGLAVHRPEVELLHVMGATDAHVARQFQRHMTRLALTGALAGFAVAALTLAGLGRMAARVNAALLPDLALSAWQWGALAAVPLLAGALAAASSRLTVIRTLERLP